MNTQIVYLPFDQTCEITVEVEAGNWQRVAVKDLETDNVLIGPWEHNGEGDKLPPTTLKTEKRGSNALGYRVEVTIESAKGGQKGPPWLPSRVAVFAGGRIPWSYCTIGSEDCESTDNDWNDATVTFAFQNVLFDPLFALPSWVGDGLRHILKA